MVDYVGVLIPGAGTPIPTDQSWHRGHEGGLQANSLAPCDVRFALTAVYDPTKDRVTLHEMYGQPFGAGHAVPNFCRVAEWISRVMQKLFHMLVDHFLTISSWLSQRQRFNQQWLASTRHLLSWGSD